jgi:glucose-1-phosphate thymidylyltransferase
VRGPTVIGGGARLIDTYVGPFTAIGTQGELSQCEIEHSIVLERNVIRDVGVRIADSLIGRKVNVEPSALKPRAARLMFGDHSIVNIV